MVNLFRAQLYRLVRNRAGWGLLMVFSVLVFLFVSQVGEEAVRQGAYRNLPSWRGASEGSSMSVGAEVVLGEFWVPQILSMFTALLAAAFFADDFKYGGVRLLDVVPSFRRAYVGSAALLMAFVSALFLMAAVLAAWLALLPNGALSIELFDGPGRFARWGLQLILASVTGALVAVVAVAATGRIGWGVVAVLVAGAVPEWLMGVVWMWGGEELAGALVGSMPPLQLMHLCYGDFTPTIAEVLSLLPWLAVMLGACWLAMRRKRL